MPPFIPLPRFMLAGEYSINAKLLYGLLLNRTTLSQKSGWLSRYMAYNDRHYANHYATIKKWLDEDSKGRSAKNYTYNDNEGECL